MQKPEHPLVEAILNYPEIGRAAYGQEAADLMESLAWDLDMALEDLTIYAEAVRDRHPVTDDDDCEPPEVAAAVVRNLMREVERYWEVLEAAPQPGSPDYPAWYAGSRARLLARGR